MLPALKIRAGKEFFKNSCEIDARAHAQPLFETILPCDDEDGDLSQHLHQIQQQLIAWLNTRPWETHPNWPRCTLGDALAPTDAITTHVFNEPPARRHLRPPTKNLQTASPAASLADLALGKWTEWTKHPFLQLLVKHNLADKPFPDAVATLASSLLHPKNWLTTEQLEHVRGQRCTVAQIFLLAPDHFVQRTWEEIWGNTHINHIRDARQIDCDPQTQPNPTNRVWIPNSLRDKTTPELYNFITSGQLNHRRPFAEAMAELL